MTILEDNIISGLEGIQKQVSERQKDKTIFKDVFDDSTSKDNVMLHISCHKLPQGSAKCPKPMSIRIPLPHQLTDADTNVFLITKDLEKGRRPSHEGSIRKYTDLLEMHNAKSLISKVISLRQLKVEYKDYEAKRKLSQAADVMLVDDRVIRLVPLFLGKKFYRSKKKPIQVNLKAKDLKKEIEKVLSLTHLHMNMTGDCFTVTVGHLGFKPSQLVENIDAVVKKLQERFPGGWDNIKSINMRTKTSQSMPLYVNLQCLTKDVKHPNYKKVDSAVANMLYDDSKQMKVSQTGKIAIKNKKFNKTAESDCSDDEIFETSKRKTPDDEELNEQEIKKRKVEKISKEDDVSDEVDGETDKDDITDRPSKKSKLSLPSIEQAYLRRLQVKQEQERKLMKKRKAEMMENKEEDDQDEDEEEDDQDEEEEQE